MLTKKQPGKKLFVHLSKLMKRYSLYTCFKTYREGTGIKGPLNPCCISLAAIYKIVEHSTTATIEENNA